METVASGRKVDGNTSLQLSALERVSALLRGRLKACTSSGEGDKKGTWDGPERGKELRRDEKVGKKERDADAEGGW